MENSQENALPAVSGLVVLLKEKNFSEETALAISPAFDELYNTAKEWNTKATEFLNNPDLSPEEKAKEARTARLALVKVRTGIDKKRKELNDSDQKRIDERNAIGKVLTGLVTPTEKMLQDEEDRAENIEKERKATLKNERLAALEPYKVDSQFFDLENMPDEAFAVLLENSSLAHQKRIDDEKIREEKEKLDIRFTDRVGKIGEIGFKFRDTIFEHDFCNPVSSDFIHSINDDDFKKFYSNVKTEYEDHKKEEENKKKAEDEKLKAEKEKAEREAALLKQQQKEKEQKHNTAIYRQQAAARMNIVLEYGTAIEMTEQGWTNWFNEKDAEYTAEQNRLFIEKKKKEREDAMAKEKAEAEEKAKREEAMAPDKIKLKIFVDRVHNVVKEFESNEFKNEEARLLYKNFFGMMERANQWANEHINNLK
jgi:hypothetical protein